MMPMRTFCLNLLALWGMVSSSGCQTVDPTVYARVSTSLSQPFVISQSTNAYGFGFLSHPRLIDYPGHGILLRYNLLGDKATMQGWIPEDLRDREPVYSGDRGATWVFGEEAKTNLPFSPFFRSIKLPDGGVFAYNALAIDNRRLHWQRIGVDGALLDSGVAEFNVEPFLGSILLQGGVAVASNHWLIAGMSVMNRNLKYPGVTGNAAFLVQSRDQGRTWHIMKIFTKRDAPWGREGPNESALMLNEANEVVWIMRTGAGGAQTKRADDMLLARSADAGQTWKTEQMRIAGAMPGLLALSNGVSVLSFGRPGNYLAFSLDGGRSWGATLALSSSAEKTSGYVAMLEVEPNRLLVVYDSYDTPVEKKWFGVQPPVNAMWGRYVEVKRRF